MQKFSEVFVPDYQQAQRYHNELLNQVRQERFARLSSGSPKPRRGSFGRQLSLLLMNLRTKNHPGPLADLRHPFETTE